MNVKINYPQENVLNTKIGIVLSSQSEDDPRYFIGACGDGPLNELYGVCYDGIFLVKCPYRLWRNANVQIAKWVDIEINVLNSVPCLSRLGD